MSRLNNADQAIVITTVIDTEAVYHDSSVTFPAYLYEQLKQALGLEFEAEYTEPSQYDVFVRDWYRDAQPGDGTWPDNLVPQAGDKTYLKGGRGLTREEAREMCGEWNAEHEPGRYSRKAEFEEA